MELSDILNGISAEDMRELRETANRILNGEKGSTAPVKSQEPAPVGFSLPDAQTLGRIMRIASALNQNDEKTNFLLALKPLLSEKRQQRADTVIMLQRLLRVLNELGNSGEGSAFENKDTEVN